MVACNLADPSQNWAENPGPHQAKVCLLPWNTSKCGFALSKQLGRERRHTQALTDGIRAGRTPFDTQPLH